MEINVFINTGKIHDSSGFWAFRVGKQSCKDRFDQIRAVLEDALRQNLDAKKVRMAMAD